VLAGRAEGGAALEGILASAAKRLRAAGIESPRREARLLLANILGIGLEDIVAGRVALGLNDQARFEAAVARRAAREPFAYIAGRREFWSLDFKVGPGVLVPRPESETLIESALGRFAARDAALDVLDLGTGSGCLLLAFLSERPNAGGVGIDASPDAIRWAEENARELGFAARARFVNADWSEAAGVYDVILVNPPYVGEPELAGLAPEVAQFEPHSALVSGADGLECYRRLAPILRARLKPAGFAFVELGQGQADAVSAIFSAAGLVVDETKRDLSGITRCLVAWAGIRGAKKDLERERRSG
jgi:release factor glutamine methyltransferase